MQKQNQLKHKSQAIHEQKVELTSQRLKFEEEMKKKRQGIVIEKLFCMSVIIMSTAQSKL